MDEEKKNRGMVTRATAKRSPDLVIHSPSASGTTFLTTTSEIRFGAEYQVNLDAWHMDDDAEVDLGDSPDRDECVWKPPENNSEDESDRIMSYCDWARKKHSIPVDKALFVLYCEDWVIPAAERRLAEHVNYDNHLWAESDKQLFYNAFCNYGKNFPKIRQLLPHKSTGSLVEQYYNTKKMQYVRSCMDDENDLFSDAEEGEKKASGSSRHVLATKDYHVVNQLGVYKDMALCRACEHYYKVNGNHRPCKLPAPKREDTCPSEMSELARSFQAMGEPEEIVNEPGSSSTGLMAGFLIPLRVRTKCGRLIEETMQQISETKGRASRLQMGANAENVSSEKLESTVQETRAYMKQLVPAQRAKAADDDWTYRERQVAFYCLTRYRGDVNATANVLGTKTHDEVREFLRENVDDVKKAIEEQGKKPTESDKPSDAHVGMTVPNPLSV
ncbi:Protein SPR-1 [Aphelenchoides avenae]|nr:Protein SPR-1 [Aphelenchus avenae]